MMRVLLVDDDDSVRLFVAAELEELGYEVIGFGSAEDALAEGESCVFDIALIDIYLPGMDGIALCQSLAQSPNGSQAIIACLSGVGDGVAIARALDAGADHYFVKPITSEKLKVVARILEKHARMKQNLINQQQRMRDFVETASDWLWESDADHRFTWYSNYNALRKDSLGRTRWDIAGAPLNDENWAAHMVDMDAQRPFSDFEYQPPPTPGYPSWISVSGRPMFGRDGTFLGYRGIARDIAARKEQELALKASQERFRDFAEVASDWFWETCPKGKFTYFSSRYQDVTGIAPETLIGLTRKELRPKTLTQTEQKDWDAHLDDLQHHKSFRQFQYRAVLKSGEKITVRVSGKPVLNDDGNFLGYRGVGSDVTKFVESQNELQQVQKRLYEAMEMIQDGFVLFDAQDRLVICNQKYKEMYGELSDILVPGVTFSEILRVSTERGVISGTPEEQKRWIETRMAQHLDPAEPIEQKLSSGTWIRVLEQKTADGGTVGLRSDITKEKREQEQLRNLSQALEQSADMVFITDTEGRIEYVNAKFTELSGYAFEEVKDQTPAILKSGKTPDRVYKNLWDTVLSGQVWRHELQDKCKDGSFFWADITIAPIKDETGTITHFVASHRDITEQKTAEKRIQDAMNRAEVANKAKSELLANMSHELRTPLNAIIGFSEAIKTEVLGAIGHERYGEYVDIIHDSGCHLLGVINDVLDVSAIEAGKMELHESRVVIADTIDAAMNLIRVRAEEGEIELDRDIAGDLPDLIGDERRIKQILINLLSNAVKFTNSGGTVTVRAVLDDAKRICLTVEDSGIGMTRNEIDLALTQFGQVDSGLNRKYEGTGLGLPLTKSLTDLHGAEFHIDSQKDKGTTVSVIFPPHRCQIG